MFKNLTRVLILVILLSFLAFGNCSNPFDCSPSESILPSEDTSDSGTDFDTDVVLELPDDVNAVFPADINLLADAPGTVVASDSEVLAPSPDDPDQVFSLASGFSALGSGNMKYNMGQNFQKTINKLGGVVTGFAQDVVDRVKSEFTDMKNLEGQWAQFNQLIPYVEEDSFNVIICKFDRPGDGTYELRLGLGNYEVAGYALNLDLFFMKWQPTADGQFKGYIIVNAKLIGYVTQAVWGVKVPFDYARVDWDLQLADPSLEVWLKGISEYPDDIPELLRFKNARVLLAKEDNGVLLKSTFEGIGNPGFMEIPSALGINMSDCMIKFVTWADLDGEGGFAAKFDNWGFRGEDPIFKKEILLEADAGVRFYFDVAGSSMGIQLEALNPTIKVGSWETNFGDVISWLLDDVIKANNWLSSAISDIIDSKIDDNQFFSSAQPADPSTFWAPFIVD